MWKRGFDDGVSWEVLSAGLQGLSHALCGGVLGFELGARC